ncbi:MAG: PaaI family thioesterase [Pseudomonadota bacterium]|nr:PaaI family thioesterase [Pseudomonadota bacterium]
MQVIEIGKGSGTMKVPYKPELIGNPKTGVIHGGVLTSLIDSCGGLAVFSALPRMEPIATLDLRIDYQKPATPEKDLFAFSECYKLTRQIAFVRAIAYQDDKEDPVATSLATFMRSSSLPRNAQKTRA